MAVLPPPVPKHTQPTDKYSYISEDWMKTFKQIKPEKSNAQTLKKKNTKGGSPGKGMATVPPEI